MLTREAILGADDLPREKVDVPEWGGAVYVRTMTGAERDKYEAELLATEDKTARLVNIRARLAGLTVCDEAGKRVFADGDIEALGAKSAAALDRIFPVAMRLNGLSATDVEGLEKN